MGLGVTLHDEGELDQAMAAGRRAIELDPKVALAHYNLGRTLNRTGNRTRPSPNSVRRSSSTQNTFARTAHWAWL